MPTQQQFKTITSLLLVLAGVVAAFQGRFDVGTYFIVIAIFIELT